MRIHQKTPICRGATFDRALLTETYPPPPQMCSRYLGGECGDVSLRVLLILLSVVAAALPALHVVRTRHLAAVHLVLSCQTTRILRIHKIALITLPRRCFYEYVGTYYRTGH